MTRRLVVLLLAVALATGWVPDAAARAAPAVVVAVIDSGLRASHQEFDYRGARSTTDQVVAWWDFTATRGAARNPRPGQRWDDRARDPYDDNGHGTAVASMAVGRNRSASKSPSAAPGYRLAVARVLNAGNLVDGDLAAAIRWATATVRADVISLSVNLALPLPAAAPVVEDLFASLQEARDAGVSVVVSNGNGWGNVGVLPGEPGWARGFGNSPAALAVGAAGEQGLLLTTDPEVVAEHVPTSAGVAADDAYSKDGGTSFAAPFVAGLAARAVQAARGHGRPADPARIEQLLKHVAVDTVTPPIWEGYGELDLAVLPQLLHHATAGTLPPRPQPDLSGAYVERVAGTLRAVWTGPLPP